jgi:cytochrome oxidase assembly protein ShyY1
VPAAPVWRTVRRPRWLALLGVVLVLCVAFAWLGHWQLDVALSKEHPKRPTATAAAVPLDQVTTPQRVFRTGMQGRRITVSGQYDASRQVLVTGKRQGGRPGFWVLTPLRVASGALVPVVRGFSTGWVVGSGPAPATTDTRYAPPAGPVTVDGVLQVPEASAAPAVAPVAGTVPAADTADLVNRWGGPIYNVLVFASSGTEAAGGRLALAPVPPVPADTGGGLGLRNAAYALQWWLFGAFALLLWWRMVRQDALDEVASSTSPPTGPPADPDTGAHEDPTEPKELSPR